MSDLDQQFLEDRALRNSAREMLKADVTHLKTGLSGKGLAERTVSRMGAGAKDAFDQASEKAGENKGVLAALIGAIILWFARNPILEALGLEEADLDALLGEDAASDDDAPINQPHEDDTIAPAPNDHIDAGEEPAPGAEYD